MSSNLNYILVTEPMAGAGGAFTDTLNRALRNVLSLSGYNPDATIFPGLAGPVYNVNAFGADPSGVADSSAAINAAAAAALAAGGEVYGPPGAAYKIASTVTFKTHLRMQGVQFNYTGTGVAVAVGASGGLVQLVTMQFPRVSQTLARTAGTWPRADVGIQIIGAIGCVFRYSGVDNFAKGVQLIGETNGCDYNVHYLSTFSNNQIAIYADGAGAAQYVNENVWIGGRPRLDYTELTGANTLETGQPGTRYVYLGNTGFGTNNHRFIGTTFEGHVPEYVVENRGTHNAFDRCRWETDATGQRFLLSGASALYTRILGGYDANKLKFTFSGGAGSIEVQQQDGLRASTGAANGHIVLNNVNGPDTPSFMIVPDAFASATTQASAYQVRLSEKSLRGKLTGDASDRISLDFSTGIATVRGIKAGVTNASLVPTSDASGLNLAVAASGTATIVGCNAALVHIIDTNSGKTALIFVGGVPSTILAQNGTTYTGTSGTANSFNVYQSGGNLVIQNTTAGVASFNVTVSKLS